MGKKRLIENGKQKTHLPGLKGGQRVAVVEAPSVSATQSDAPAKTKTASKEVKVKSKKTAKPARVRGKKFLEARKKVDSEKNYPIPEAVKLLKETATSNFDGSVEVHFKVTEKLKGEANLPYFKAAKKKVAIADEALLTTLEKGKIDFDILLASPEFMPRLAKFAKILGPKGLMPNPKAGTIVKDPQKEMARFETASFSFQAEKNEPLVHTVIGKVSQPEKELEANLKALLLAVNPKKIKKVVLTSTMGPGIKIDISAKIL